MPRHSHRPPTDRLHAPPLQQAHRLSHTLPQQHALKRALAPARIPAALDRSSCSPGKASPRPWCRPLPYSSTLGNTPPTTFTVSCASPESFESPFQREAMPLLKLPNSCASSVSAWKNSIRSTRIPQTIVCPSFMNSNNSSPSPFVISSLKGRSNTAKPEGVSIDITRLD